jgi:hypothetical protein
MTMRRQVEHPSWSWMAAREAADAVCDDAYAGMLTQLQLG